MSHPTFQQIVDASESCTVTQTAYTSGETISEKKWSLPVSRNGGPVLVWVATDLDRSLGLTPGWRYAVKEMELDPDVWRASVMGCKICKNGTIELTQHYLGKVEVT